MAELFQIPPPSLDWSNPFRVHVEVTALPAPHKVHSRKVLRFIADYFGIEQSVILGPWRTKTVAEARHIAIWITRRTTALSYPQIADLFCRDHSTIIAAYRRIEAAVDEGSDLGRVAKSCLAEFRRLYGVAP